MMALAADVMAQALAEINIKDAFVPVVQNVTVVPETSASVYVNILSLRSQAGCAGAKRWLIFCCVRCDEIC